MKTRSELSAIVGAALLLAPLSADAYCRTAACASKDSAWQVCAPEEADDCGTPLFWGNRCVGFTLQKDASVQVGLADAEVAFKSAFDVWMNADCGNGSHPSISIEYQGPVECDAQEYNKKKRNANIVVFRDDAWPYSSQGTVLALTTVTYNLETSEIYDADMELNSASISSFTIGDADVKYDLLSIATHETGHFLGLAHSKQTDATMFTDYKLGSTFLRDLTPDDVAGICAAYPPAAPKSADCDPEPRHGFSADCGDVQTEPPVEEEETGGGSGGCAVTTPRPAGEAGDRGASWVLGLIALASLSSFRRRVRHVRRAVAARRGHCGDEVPRR